jgi:hypothetical protein
MSTPNTIYPGRHLVDPKNWAPYTGPTVGEFGALHHNRLSERSINVMERVDYVQRQKPENERASRLWQMCYLDSDRLPAEYNRTLDLAEIKCIRANAEYDRANAEYDRANAEYDRAYVEYAPQIEALIRALVPDMTWNGREYVYPVKGRE